MTPPRIVLGAPPIRPLRLRSFSDVLDELDRLERASTLVCGPGWDVPHVLDHCARSIACSLRGFRELKPALFRATVGAAAFHVFDWRGRMRHDLGSELPGDAGPSGVLPFEQAVIELRERIAEFDRWTGAMQPHFAYGSLTKAQYERAHAMHFANHVSALEYAGRDA